MGALVMEGAPWVIDLLAVVFAWLFVAAVALAVLLVAAERRERRDRRPGVLIPLDTSRARARQAKARRRVIG